MDEEHSFRGRSALITGGGVRVGRAIALELGRCGCDVTVHYRRSGAAAEEVASGLRLLGVRAQTAQADLTGDAAPERLLQAHLDFHGGLDLLVNCAAEFERLPAEQIDRARFESMLSANLTAPFLLARAALPALRKSRGAIVNLVDLCGTSQVWKGYAHYAAAKAGLATLTRLLALEWAPEVRVNAVAPGTVLFPESLDEAERARIVSKIPLGRVGSPEDVARAVRFLASQPFLTGQVLAVDGGRELVP